MNLHLPADRLNDLADGALDADPRAQAERHLAVCETCRAEVESIRALRARLQALPQAIEPPRDLRPVIRAAIDAAVPSADPSAGPPPRPVPRWRDRAIASMRWPLAAAALLLVAVTAAITFALTRRRAAAPAVAYSVYAPAFASVLAIAERYDRATTELQRIVDEQRTHLSPATIRILEDNLRILDRAVSESKAALEGDPGNAALSAMLISAYEKKLGVLRSATTTMGI